MSARKTSASIPWISAARAPFSAPHNRLLRVVGTAGFATIPDVWDNRPPSRISPTGKSLRERVARKLELRLG